MAASLPSSRTYPSLERKKGKNDTWIEAAGGLPDLVERIAKHLHYEEGFTISRAIATAVNTVKTWSSGKNHNGSDVSAATQAKAAAAVASWEAKKARAKGRSIAESVELSEAEREYLDGYLRGLESQTNPEGRMNHDLDYLRGRALAEAGKPWEKPWEKDGDDSKGEGMKRCPSCKMKNAKGKEKCWKCKGPLAKKGDAKLSEGRVDVKGYSRKGERGKLIRVKGYMKDGMFDVAALRDGTPKHIDVNERANGRELSVWVPGAAMSSRTVRRSGLGGWEIGDLDGMPSREKFATPEAAVERAVADADGYAGRYSMETHARVGGPIAGYDDHDDVGMDDTPAYDAARAHGPAPQPTTRPTVRPWRSPDPEVAHGPDRSPEALQTLDDDQLAKLADHQSFVNPEVSYNAAKVLGRRRAARALGPAPQPTVRPTVRPWRSPPPLPEPPASPGTGGKAGKKPYGNLGPFVVLQNDGKGNWRPMEGAKTVEAARKKKRLYPGQTMVADNAPGAAPGTDTWDGKAEYKKHGPTTAPPASPGTLGTMVNFGGIPTPLGQVIATMQAEGHPQVLIDRYIQGLRAGGQMQEAGLDEAYVAGRVLAELHGAAGGQPLPVPFV